MHKKLMKNLTKLPCLEVEFDNYKWAVILTKPEEYAESRIKKVNLQRYSRAIEKAKAVLAQLNPPVDLTTVSTQSVLGNWIALIASNAEAQLPAIKNPGHFKSNTG